MVGKHFFFSCNSWSSVSNPWLMRCSVVITSPDMKSPQSEQPGPPVMFALLLSGAAVRLSVQTRSLSKV